MNSSSEGGEPRTAEEKIIDAGYEDVLLLSNYSYDDALIGVTEDGRAVYDYNTIRALPYMGEQAPIIMYPLPE